MSQKLLFQALPLEIILAIFELVVCGNHGFVVILAQVCQGWRQAVVSTPILWSTLTLLGGNKPVEKAKLWRSRNQGLLRGLHIQGDGEDIKVALAVFNDAALDHLRSLSVSCMTNQNLCSVLPQLTPRVISNLDNLDMRFSRGPWFTGTSELRLRSLSCIRSELDWDQLEDHCTELRHLTSRPFVKGPDILWLLHRNPKLESCSLRCYHSESTVSLPPPTPRMLPSCIELHDLTKLSLSGHGNPTPATLLHRLSLPSLRSFELRCVALELSPIINALIDIGVVPRLATIKLSCDKFTTELFSLEVIESLANLMRKAITLDCLQLAGIACVDALVKALSQDPRVLCPRLTTLGLAACHLPDKLLMALVEALTDRVNSPTPVAKLHTLVLGPYIQVTDSGMSWVKERVPQVTQIEYP
ncbi:hypothetical protein BC835DRAFT_369756 [Cytidiella melzeri]|nr:hypothetical protein BC835DRAFT_369756 [Cytidiella melzeri]